MEAQSNMIRVILCTVFVAVFVSISASPVEEVEKRNYVNSGKCYVNGNTYANGEVFTIPGFSQCLKYRCANGGWDIHEEGCQHNGRCHRVGSSYEDKCRTYTCTKSKRNGYDFYQSINTRSRCQDHYGRCHNPGNKFTYVIKGRLHNKCTCSVHGSVVNYNCRGK